MKFVKYLLLQTAEGEDLKVVQQVIRSMHVMQRGCASYRPICAPMYMQIGTPCVIIYSQLNNNNMTVKVFYQFAIKQSLEYVDDVICILYLKTICGPWYYQNHDALISTNKWNFSILLFSHIQSCMYIEIQHLNFPKICLHQQIKTDFFQKI